ncbi:hypothetical protein [Georgenia deserti]|uniref:Uncharacterized protein n=1 Tax=Georgenia deserti TaxID=2093781 RepID=A0ABW4L771_9MICO
MTEVLAQCLDRLAGIEQGAGVEVAEGMGAVLSLDLDAHSFEGKTPDAGVEALRVERASFASGE